MADCQVQSSALIWALRLHIVPVPPPRAVSGAGEVRPWQSQPHLRCSWPGTPAFPRRSDSVKSSSGNLAVLRPGGRTEEPRLDLSPQLHPPVQFVGVVCYQASAGARVLIPICLSGICGYAQLVRTEKGGGSEPSAPSVLFPRPARES